MSEKERPHTKQKAQRMAGWMLAGGCYDIFHFKVIITFMSARLVTISSQYMYEKHIFPE